MDSAHLATEREINKLSGRLKRVYGKAYEESKSKYESLLKDYDKERSAMLKTLDGTAESKAQFKKWSERQAQKIAQRGAVTDSLALDLANTDVLARDMVKGTLPSIFASNYNFSAKNISSQLANLPDHYRITFSMVDTATVKELITKNPQLLPIQSTVEKGSSAYSKAVAYNKRTITTAVTQGILQGEPVKDIANRIGAVYDRCANSATRYARTACTCAENSGRLESYRSARSLGIEMEKEWIATPDDRTRPSHIDADGQRIDIDDYFDVGNAKMEAPGDPAGGDEAWNCRCTLRARVKGYKNSGKATEYHRNSIEDELQRRSAIATAQQATAARNVVNGKNILGTWERRPEQFAFEIEDIMNAQGFDGLPRVVSAEEFDAAVKAANDGKGFIAQRTYSAPSQDILDAYREQLYSGKWYVDCSTGGAQYGQGMYCAADYTGTLTQGIKNEMEHYKSIYEKKMSSESGELAYRYAQGKITPKEMKDIADSKYTVITERQAELYYKHKLNVLTTEESLEYRAMVKEQGRTWRYSASNAYDVLIEKYKLEYVPSQGAYVETMTLDPSAKIIEYKDLRNMHFDEIHRRRAGITENVVAEYLEKNDFTGGERDLFLWGLNADKAQYPFSMDVATEAKSAMSKERYAFIQEQHSLASDKIYKMQEEAVKDIANMDLGSFAASMGYDVINAVGHGESGSYTVILNRTKLIIKEPK